MLFLFLFFLFRFGDLNFPGGDFAQRCDNLPVFALDCRVGTLENHFGPLGRRMNQRKAVGNLGETIFDGYSGHIDIFTYPFEWKKSSISKRFDAPFKLW